MTITEEELQRIVARAVKVALNEIHGSDEQTESSSPSTTEEKVEIKQFSEEEWDEARRLMESNRGKDDEPKVGIFWYDPRKNDLFGVR